MLVLTRKVNRPVYLLLPDGSRVAVQVVKIRGDAVRLGIDAPDAVKILRGELIEDDTPDNDTPENTDAGARTSGGEGAATKAA